MTRRGIRILVAAVVASTAGLGLALTAGRGAVTGVATIPTAAEAAAGPAAESRIRGVWTAERSRWRVENGETATLVQLSLRRVGGKGEWNSGETVPLAELPGLTAAMLDAPSADARFEWVRDAGRFALQGRFVAGAGAGHFTFAPNPDYVADMRRRGYGDIDDEKGLQLALHDVSRAFVGELASLGYERLPLDQLFSLRIHGASPEFIRGLSALGYRKVTVDDLVSLRIHGASLDFVREMQGLGFTGLDVEKLVSFRIHGVSPEYVRAFRGQGYASLTGDQLVSMRIHGVSPEFVKELKGLGYSGIAVDDLVSLRIHGVTGEFIRRVQGRSGRDVSVERLVSMRIHGEGSE